MGVIFVPDVLDGEQGLLLWLVALIPPFLLTYYRGWRGASIGLASGMAALTAANLILLLTQVTPPNFTLLLWVTSTYIVVCIGAGVLVELLRRERRMAEEMALTDTLTGLPNRRHVNVFLDAAFAAATRGQSMTVVLFEVDGFRELADRFGYASADSVLKRVGGLLTETTRRMDLSARWSAEVFITVLSRSPTKGAEIFADRILSEIQKEGFPWGAITISAGIAEYEAGMGSPELLAAAADRALYAAKKGGRNQVRVARLELDAASADPDRPSASVPPLAVTRGPELYSAHHRGIRLRSGADAPAFLPSGPGRKGGEELSRHLPTGRERILVIDDNDQARRGVAKILAHLGYEVVQASDGESALTAAREDPRLDLVITDLIMPGMSGFTLIDRMQWEFGPRRVLYMSGFVQGDFSWDGAPGGLVSFLGKPMTANVLANQVRALLDLDLPLHSSAGTL
jgi:diguanylate cyclase (GGDEF)-like protein